MPYIIVDNFAAGLDSRRHVLNSKDGTLAVLKNAHITRGGEIEKRKAFAQYASLPANTFGLETTQDAVYVFGSVSPPAMPAGVTYQRLQHPEGYAMTSVVTSSVYGGLPFVIAEYSDGKRFSFWNGAVIKDWFAGVATPVMGSLANFAEHMRLNFSIPGFSCVRTDASLTITGPIAKPFTITTEKSGTIDPILSTPVKSLEPIPPVPAQAVFQLMAGSENVSRKQRSLRFIDGPDLPGITGIYLEGNPTNYLSILSATGLKWDTYPEYAGWNVGPRLSHALTKALSFNPDQTVYGEYSVWNRSGTDNGFITLKINPQEADFYNGKELYFEFVSDPSSTSFVDELIDGGSIVASPYTPGRFIGTFGVLTGGERNGFTYVKADGVHLFDKYVPFMTSSDRTMSSVNTAINENTDEHGFISERRDQRGESVNGLAGSLPQVVVYAPAAEGSSANGKSFEIQTVGDLVATGEKAFFGGANEFVGQAQVSVVAFGGSFSAGSKVSIYITPEGEINPRLTGASRVANLQPSVLCTYKSKSYAAVGSTVYFSSLNDATKWGVYDIGTGFIDMSNNFGGREPITGLGVYQDKLAVFSRRNVQLWFMDPDPSQNQQLQVLANTGSIAPDSVVSMGAIDVIYLADNGVRSLRAREGTDTAFANDIGSAIDSIVISHLASLTDAQKYAAKALVEPIDGRYWLALGNKVYVLSYFPGASITAWSTYEPGFTIDELASQGNRVFARSGNTIYLYGGVDGNTYDSSEVEIEMPYLDAKKPATYKRAKAIDLTVDGQWSVHMGFDHTNPTARDLIANILQPTFAMGTIPAVGIGTHFGLRLVNSSAGYAKLSNVIVHFDELQPKHEAG